MSPLECAREQDVIDAIASGRWPHRTDVELCEHVARCAVCADVAAVVAAFASEHEESTEAAVLPPADLVWYRAQIRARAEATRLAARPIALVQALAIACALGAIASAGGTLLTWLRSAVASAAAVAASLSPPPGGVDALALALRGALLAVAIGLVLAPVAVYLTATDE